jgi:hypothetical protein
MAPLTQRERFHLCDGFSMRSHAAPVSGRRNNQIVKGSGPMITSTLIGRRLRGVQVSLLEKDSQVRPRSRSNFVILEPLRANRFNRNEREFAEFCQFLKGSFR